MIEKNTYKPRYKIAFQSKNKIWPYKNSRLRRFFNIRGRKLIRRGLFKRYFLVFNNMKWTIARRYIRPYARRRGAAKRQYREVFYAKQRLRVFYGKVSETSFRKFFKNYSGNINTRNGAFFAALERRLDMVVFRMRFLPTIYACNQFVHHQGVLVNGKLENSANSLVRPGDVISINRKYWRAFAFHMLERIYWRSHGKFIWRRRQKNLLRKKSFWIMRTTYFKKGNISLLKKINEVSRYIPKMTRKFRLFFKAFLHKIAIARASLLLQDIPSRKKTLDALDHLEARTMLLKKQYKLMLNTFARIHGKSAKKKWKMRVWRWRNYYVNFLKIFSKIIYVYKSLSFFFLRAKIEELNFYGIVLNNDETAKIKLGEFLTEKKSLLQLRYALWAKKLESVQNSVIQRRINRYATKMMYNINAVTGKKTLRKSALVYFLTFKRFKKERKLLTNRLRPVHWYVPSYIHFDFETLRAVYMYNPRPDEVTYSFKCSISKIHSFYKSRGL